MLGTNLSGLPTSAMSGTRQFHGENTLSNAQIIRLLRKSGRATMRIVGNGSRTQGWWTLATKADMLIEKVKRDGGITMNDYYAAILGGSK